MKRLRAVMLAVMAVLVMAIPGLSWGAGSALIVHDGTAGLEANVVANLTAHLTAATFTTITPNVGVPAGSLAGYDQIWDIRFNNTTPLSASDMAAYTTYLAGGGSLFVMGENMGFATRNNSITSFVAGLGGGNLSLNAASNTQTVQPPFNSPNALTTVVFLAAAGATTTPGNGAFVTKDASNIGASVVFAPGSLSGANAGTLILVFDVNFLDLTADANSHLFTDNLIAFLAAPVPVVPKSVPTISEWGMIIMAVLMLGAGLFVMRRMKGVVQ